MTDQESNKDEDYMIFESDYFDIYYEMAGSGEPVIFIPGGFCDHRVWYYIKDDISRFFQMILLDNRGAGLSKDNDAEYDVKLLATDVLRLMEHLNIEKAHIVGHSMGGFVAQYFAAHYPGKVISLALLSSILKMNEQGRQFLDQIFIEAEQDPDTLLDRIINIGGVKQTLQQVLKQARLCRDYNAKSYIHLITAPTILMSGQQEPIMSVTETRKLEAAINFVNEVAIFNCNHMLPIEVPRQLSEKLIRHLKN